MVQGRSPDTRADTRAPRMGKTKKRQAKRAAVEAAARLEQAGASGERVGSALAAGGDGMHVGDARDANDPRWIAARDNAMDPDSRFKVAQVKLKRNPMAGVSKPKTKQKTGIPRIARAVEASLTQEACVALDTLLAECERGEREVAAPMDLCGKVLAMCQRGSFGKPAIRLLGRMERGPGPPSPSSATSTGLLRVCGQGHGARVPVADVPTRHGDRAKAAGEGRLSAGVRGCHAGGADGPAGPRKLEARFHRHQRGRWEGAPSSAAGGSVVRVHAHPTWAPPRGGGCRGCRGCRRPRGGCRRDSRRRCIREATTGTRPSGLCATTTAADDPRTETLELWAPATASTIPLVASGLELETERHDAERAGPC